MPLTRSLLTSLSLVALMAAPALALKPGAPGPSYFATHAFYGRGNGLAVPAAKRFKPNDKVLVFQAGKEPVWATVTREMPTKEAKDAFDKQGFENIYDKPALWAKYGSYWGLKGPDAPPFIAQLSTGVEHTEPVLALRALPTGTAWQGSTPTVLKPEAIKPLLNQVPAAQRPPKPLLHGIRYGKVAKPSVVDLFVGAPRYLGKSTTDIRTITFKRYTYVDGRLAGTAEFSRESGVEERADTEAPQLTTSNWHDLTEKTVGFVRLAGSPVTHRMIVDIGFEGLQYRIGPVATPDQPVFEVYHYTPH